MQLRWLRGIAISISIGLIGLLAAGAVPARAQGKGEPSPEEVVIPERTAYVVDAAGVVEDDVETGLDRALARVEEEHGVQIFVLTVRATEPLPIKRYALRVWESWGLDKEDPKRKTLIFLVAVEDGQVMLSTSRGLQEVLPDETLGEILRKTILPAFERKAFAEGIVAGVQAMIQALAEEEEGPPVGARPFQERRLTTVDVLGILLALALLAALVWWVQASA